MLVLTTLLQTFLVHIPTVLLSLLCIAAMQGVKVEPRRIGAYSIVGGAALTLFRNLPGPPGLHVPLTMVMLIALSRMLTHGRWPVVVLGVLITLLLTGVGEGLLALPLLTYQGLSVEQILASPVLTMLATWIGNVPLIGFFIYLYVRGRRDAQAI